MLKRGNEERTVEPTGTQACSKRRRTTLKEFFIPVNTGTAANDENTAPQPTEVRDSPTNNTVTKITTTTAKTQSTKKTSVESSEQVSSEQVEAPASEAETQSSTLIEVQEESAQPSRTANGEKSAESSEAGLLGEEVPKVEEQASTEEAPAQSSQQVAAHSCTQIGTERAAGDSSEEISIEQVDVQPTKAIPTPWSGEVTVESKKQIAVEASERATTAQVEEHASADDVQDRSNEQMTIEPIAIESNEQVASESRTEVDVQSPSGPLAVPANEAVAVPASEAVAVPANEAVAVPANEAVAVPANEAVAVPASEAVAVPANEAVAVPEEPKLDTWDVVLGVEWATALRTHLTAAYFTEMMTKVADERKRKIVYPPENLVFTAFRQTPLSSVKAVIVGQDPYHGPGQAMGMCFSVPRGVTVPPSLNNIYKEIGIKPGHGDLTEWGLQGVFLLNSLLTVVKSTPMAHKAFGWAKFTDAVVQAISDQTPPVVFLLWGKPAQAKGKGVDRSRHMVLEAGHPSPLSVRFFQGCQHFTKCNSFLESKGRSPIIWSL